MAKKVKTTIKLNAPGGQATAAPPVGPILGQHGLPIMDFVKTFNERTKDLNGTVVPVVITVYEDRTFSFIVKKPPVSVLIKKTLGLEKGAATAGKQTVAKISNSKLKISLVCYFNAHTSCRSFHNSHGGVYICGI